MGSFELQSSVSTAQGEPKMYCSTFWGVGGIPRWDHLGSGGGSRGKAITDRFGQ